MVECSAVYQLGKSGPSPQLLQDRNSRTTKPKLSLHGSTSNASVVRDPYYTGVANGS